MNKTAILLIAAISWLFATAPSAAKIPPIPDSLGVSAPFAAIVGERLVVAGGCNFPDKPAADGGKKRFYADAYCWDIPADSNNGDGRKHGDVRTWKRLPSLPAPTAYGTAVQHEGKIICISGTGPSGATADVWALYLGEKRKTEWTRLPSLPAAIDNGAAAIVGSTVYVTGGNQPSGARRLFCLDLKDPKAWEELPSYPSPARIQPVVAAHGSSLYLIGGFSTDTTSGQCLTPTEILRYDIKEKLWTACGSVPPMPDGSPRAIVGASAVTSGDSLIIAGGVCGEIFRPAVEGRAPADYLRRPMEWYRFNASLLILNAATSQWTVTSPRQGFARAGGVLLQKGRKLFMVCGETKPGIRSPQVSETDL